MKTYIVQLEPHDDVISTQDKISWSKARRVILIWPAQEKILERLVDVLLLQRYSQKMGVQLAFVTHSHEVRNHAQELGIPVFYSPLKAQKAIWRRGAGGKHPLGRMLPLGRMDNAEAPERKPVASDALRTQWGSFSKQATLRQWVRWGAFGIGVVAFLALVLFFVPSATIRLSPVEQQQKIALELRANPAIPSPNITGGVPAYPVQVIVEGRESTASTGLVFLPDRPATGEIELTNLTDHGVDVPAGSVVLSQDQPPVRFKTTRAVELPGTLGAKVVVSIQAEQMGSKGNIGMGHIHTMEGPVGLNLLVNNPLGTTGGSDQISPSPRTEDYALLRAKLLDQLRQTAQDELKNQVGVHQHLLVVTLHVKRTITEEGEPQIDQPGDRLNLTMQAEYEAWYVKDEDIQTVGNEALNANLPKGFVALSPAVKTVFTGDPIVDPDGTARWMISAERKIHAVIARDQVMASIQGRNLGDALKQLKALPLAASPQIELFPSWWARMPFFLYRMNVVLP